MRRRRLVGGLAAVVALVAATGCAGSTERKASADGSPRTRHATRAPVVMFLGDSYTVGKIGQMPERTYAAEAARALRWQVIIAGFRGTGFIARGHIGKDFATLFDEQLSWRPAPDLVIIAGGHNDRIYQPGAVTEAARRLVSSVHLLWKGTKVVLVGPMWGGDPTPDVLATRDALGRAATEAQVPFVDPLGERWIFGDRLAGTGNTRQYILKDGTHPTAEGALYFAGRLINDLRAMRLTQP